MWGASNMLLGVVLLVCGVGKGFSYGAPLQKQFPLGTVGCLFTKHLCRLEEECVDDLLFGNCQSLNTAQDPYKYQLSRKSLKSLEKHIRYLIKGGYSWRDALTQCVLQNALYAYRQRQTFHPSICQSGTASSDRAEDVGSEISAVLEKLFQDYYNAYRPTTKAEGLGRSQKRDEIVHVHKYFDKSPEPYIKRDWIPDVGQNFLSYLSSRPDTDPYVYDSSDDIENEGLTLDNLRSLQYYLQQLKNDQSSDSLKNQEYSEYGLPVFEAQDYDAPITDIDSDQDSWQDAMSESRGDNSYGWSNEADLPDMESSEQDTDLPAPDDDLPPLSSSYAELLSKLMYGELKPENLTDEQLDFLSNYVTARLQQMGFSDEEIKALQISPELESSDNEVSAPSIALENSMASAVEDMPSMDSPVDGGQDNSVSETMEMEEPQQGAPVSSVISRDDVEEKEDDKRVLGIPVVGSISEEKKSVLASETPDSDDLVNTDYAFIEVSEHLSVSSANKLLSILEEKLNIPPRTFSPVKDIGNKLIFYVDESKANMNASMVAQKADELKKDLESATGLTIINTGIGLRNTVEFKSRDDRYFVLTFVLCGCIAGILLAVVVIYLIRRYSRSKEKLAQLSASGDTAEASKDYQDLCRQRMQGKSSEKPEPLHAASRIGSVSESQVRSPSSRSSTSSWSEEPVASNMDISTGHVVLSYMEDHLKNKDRLDREWEGLCAYEADPSSTKVASDGSNLRKNRYSDILPYDHSRVVLSNASNVSGSDYINASSITDHDPRNPAYIATQGPLPHTIADFWQMVWEQGSVVIVMLSKMTENGEAMCHRYWPEEGSDLYHIYEVHLVSEHIWCDDYLVRSFYLKNLQTNETRTVTMFHFLTWPDLGVPGSIKALLDFRRKVNKSYRGRSCPIAVHCSDGCGRTGTYCLIDMVLNRMAKGAKEIDIAATLEHIRDQRMDMVKTKEQFQFALAAVAEEVHAILKALPQ